MRILVTGGAGYIGSQTVRSLIRNGHEPIVLDTLERGHRAAVEGAPLVVGSVADRTLVRRLLADEAIEAVIHFAGLKAAGESTTEPGRYFDVNVGGSLALLAEVERAGIRSFVYSSTCAVYGEPAALPVDEESKLQPTTPYGESKLLVERALPWFGERGLRFVALRYFNAAGAESDGSHGEDWSDATNLIPLVIRAALAGSPHVEVFGTDYPTADGTAIRDYVHVADLADAHQRALDHLARGGGSATINLGTGRGASVHEVVEAVERLSGRPVPRIKSPRRPGDVAAVWADPSRADTTLGWRARLGLDDIVQSALRWHGLHPNGYEDDPKAIVGRQSPVAGTIGARDRDTG